MYIGYDVKGGAKYAKICKSERIDGKVKTTQVSLGRVIDEKAGIYRSRERGVFTYDRATGAFGTPSPSTAIPAVKRKNAREKLILDFGDAFFVDGYIERIGLGPAIGAMKYGNPDSVKALLMFYILCHMVNYNASEWFGGSYARLFTRKPIWKASASATSFPPWGKKALTARSSTNTPGSLRTGRKGKTC
jgi:hypothetical protein